MVLSIRSYCLALVVAGIALTSCFAQSTEEKTTPPSVIANYSSKSTRFAEQAARKPAALPAELQGVWTVVSGEADGEKLKFARGADTETGEWRFNEIIVQADRWIINDNWGQALVYRAKVVTTHPLKQVRVWGDRAETQKGGVSRFIYRVNGDELTVCLGKEDHPPTEFNAAKGSGQVLFVLKRAN
jgi:uncharacterized protein (TIGR03067 family)